MNTHAGTVKRNFQYNLLGRSHVGSDIHTLVQVKRKAHRVPYLWGNSDIEVFDCRSYGIFGFLANVRNYSEVPCISEPRGLPDDWSQKYAESLGLNCGGYHSCSWLSLTELLNYDYNVVFWDRRISRVMSTHWVDGAATAKEGEGRMIRIRDFLGDYFFEELFRMLELSNSDDVRLVFWFDN